MNFAWMDLRLSRGRLSKSAFLLLSAFLASGTVACGSDGGEPEAHVEPGPDAGHADPSLARIEVTPASASVVERRTVELSAKGFDEGDAELEGIDFTWASSDESLATVDDAGLVTSLRPGEVTITVSGSGKSAEAAITITESAVTSFELQADATEVSIDGKLPLHAIVKDAEGFELLGRNVVIESEDESIATVSEDGIISGVNLGETKITAKLDAFEDSIDIRVVHRFTKLFAGPNNTCGLTSLGRAWCWGHVDGLGNGIERPEDPSDPGAKFPTRISVPVRVAMEPGVAFQTLALGENFGCGLTTDEKVFCWGSNSHLVLGRDDSGLWSGTPLLLDDRSYKTISAMGYGVCGLDDGGFAHCWGYGSGDYELGNPDAVDNTALPVPVVAPVGEASPVAFNELRHGEYYSCGLTASGKLYCWGYNTYGQLGDGSDDSRAYAVAPLGDRVIKSFDLGVHTACAVLEDDTTYCWGGNDYGQANWSDRGRDVERPVVRFEASSFVPASFALGEGHGCALGHDERAFCWGGNERWQLGRPTEEEVADIGEVFGDLRFTQLVSGNYYSCGLAKDGKAYCWGYNGRGQLGSGDFENTEKPTAVLGQ